MPEEPNAHARADRHLVEGKPRRKKRGWTKLARLDDHGNPKGLRRYFRAGGYLCVRFNGPAVKVEAARRRIRECGFRELLATVPKPAPAVPDSLIVRVWFRLDMTDEELEQ